MAANTPDEPYFWGWETLVDSPLFTVHMDANSSRVSVHLNRAMGPEPPPFETRSRLRRSDFGNVLTVPWHVHLLEQLGGPVEQVPRPLVLPPGS